MYDLSTLANFPFKVIKGKAHTSNLKEDHNENLRSNIFITANDIWAQNINSDPVIAQADGVSSALITFVLEPIVGTYFKAANAYTAYACKINGAVPLSLIGKRNRKTNLTYQPNDFVGDIIPEFFDSAYRPVIKNNGVELSKFSNAKWIFDFVSGVFVQEPSISMINFVSGTVECYLYIGDFVSDITSGGGEIDGGTFAGIFRTIKIRKGTFAELEALMSSIDPMKSGELGFTTDTFEVFISDGVNLYGVGGVIYDVIANIPIAGISGRWFYATDEKVLYLDNGIIWNAIGGKGTEENFDFQHYVLATQYDAGLDPGIAPNLGDRYLILDASALHVNFGTITDLEDNDIVEYDGTQFYVSYNVSEQPSGLVWDLLEICWKYWDGTVWNLFSTITAGTGLQLIGNVMSILEIDGGTIV